MKLALFLKLSLLLLCLFLAVPSGAMPVLLESYIHDFDKIPGWFALPMVEIISKLDAFQASHAITGNVAEIGVYHGKSFIPLYAVCHPGYHALAIDVFDLQQFNYDGSGGNCSSSGFTENVKKYVDTTIAQLIVIKADSSSLQASDYIIKGNNKKIRLFSIDGCHRAQETYHDLKNAYLSLERGGVIIIDDYFNQDWPAVSEGVCSFLITEKPDLKPFFIGHNKILLTHSQYVSSYVQYLASFYPPKKSSSLFGSQVLIY